MMKWMTVVLLMGLSACTASGYKQFYHSYDNLSDVPDVQVLAKGEEPQVYSTNDFDRDVRILMAKGYFPIGYSAFNGGMEPIENVKAQARNVGALIVLTSQAYTNTHTSTVPLFIPNNSTTYSSGTVYGYGGSATYSGRSTTYGSSVVPITTQQQRYDQNAVYLVRSTKKPRFGIGALDLTPEMRQKLERNTGAVIDIVREDSPAFFANVLPGDILITLNGVEVRNAQHAVELMYGAPKEAGDVPIVVIRNQQTKDIVLHLDAG